MMSDGTFTLADGRLMKDGKCLARITKHQDGWWRVLTHRGSCLNSGYNYQRLMLYTWNERQNIEGITRIEGNA